MTPPQKPRGGTPRRLRTLWWGVGLTVAVVAVGVARPRFLAVVDYKIYDAYLAEEHLEPPDEPVIVTVDEASLERYGQWPWPRGRVADLLERIAEAGPAAVGLDLLFPEPEGAVGRDLSDGDRALARALGSGPFVLGQEFAFGPAAPVRVARLIPLPVVRVDREGGSAAPSAVPEADGVVGSIPALAEAVSSIGFLNAAPDSDGVLRASPLVIRYRGRLYPSLPLSVAMAARGVVQIRLETGAQGLEGVGLGEGLVPVDSRGNLLLRYRGPAGFFPRVSAADVLEGRVPEGVLRGRVVFVGATAFGLDETVATPLDGVMPGLEVIATVADNLLRGDFVRRPAYGPGLELFGALGAGLGATALLFGCPPAWGVPVLLVGAVGLWRGAAWVFHAHGLFLSPLFPVAALFVAGAGLVLARYLDAAQGAADGAEDLAATQRLMLEALSSLAEIRDRHRGSRQWITQERVRILCEALTARGDLGRTLSAQRVDTLARLAPLHDIGKMGVPDDVLLKSGPLSDVEFAMIKKHTAYGEQALQRARDRVGADPGDLLELAKEVVNSHHERWDGAGYPRGLKGEAIPLAGRIVAVVDVYEAVLEPRSYRRVHDHHEAVEIIRQGAGSQFDPVVVDALLEVAPRWATLDDRGPAVPASIEYLG